jgi:hypothetical protein
MRADIIHGVVRAIHIKDGDTLPFDLNTPALTCGDFAGLGHFDKIGHAFLLGPND